MNNKTVRRFRVGSMTSVRLGTVCVLGRGVGKRERERERERQRERESWELGA